MLFALLSSPVGLVLGTGFVFCFSPERISYAGGDLAKGKLQPFATSSNPTQAMTKGKENFGILVKKREYRHCPWSKMAEGPQYLSGTGLNANSNHEQCCVCNTPIMCVWGGVPQEPENPCNDFRHFLAPWSLGQGINPQAFSLFRLISGSAKCPNTALHKQRLHQLP